MAGFAGGHFEAQRTVAGVVAGIPGKLLPTGFQATQLQGVQQLTARRENLHTHLVGWAGQVHDAIGLTIRHGQTIARGQDIVPDDGRTLQHLH